MENNHNFNNNQNTPINTALNNTENKTAKKGKKARRALSYALVGLICTTLGGVASGAATLYVLPKTDIFKSTELYKVAAKSNTAYDNHPTQLAVEGGTMSVSDIAKKVSPAVVAVKTTSKGSPNYLDNQSLQQGVGSGMIINEEGYILTNYHVVEGAQQVKVVLSDGKEVNAKVVNYDANYDVAVIKIIDNTQVPAVVELGDSDSLQVGEQVVAIGNPLGTDFFGSVTTGIVSALNRKIEGDTNNLSYIQTDTAINEGNSGGPLINSKGQIIGINTAKIKESGVEGLSFAIPINAVINKIPDLSKPILTVGIQGREVDSKLSQQYNIPVGVYVQDITEFSPAEKAGVKPGDVIIKFDGQKVATFNEINSLKNKHKSGDEVSITVSRDGKEITLNLVLAAQ